MYLIFGLGGLVRVVLQIYLGAAVVWLVVLWILGMVGHNYWPEEPVAFARHLSLLASFVTAFLALFGLVLWRPLWRWWKWPSQLLFPDLNGVWEGTVSCSFGAVTTPLIKAAKGESPPFDPATTERNQQIEEAQHPLRLSIRANWFTISMRMETPNKYSESLTVALVPMAAKGINPPQLVYVYENRTANPRINDAPSHDGAGRISVIMAPQEERPDSVVEKGPFTLRLEGLYWTNRMWNRGFSTAGLIAVRRVHDDPDAFVKWGEEPATGKAVACARPAVRRPLLRPKRPLWIWKRVSRARRRRR